MDLIQQLKQRIKHTQHPATKYCFALYKKLSTADLPLPISLYRAICTLHLSTVYCLQTISRLFYWTPMFKSRLQNQPKQLYLYCGMPLLLGALDIYIGNNCRINGITTFCGRNSTERRARLIIGDNVDVSWQSTLAVGTHIIIEDNVRLAAKAFLAGYPGHPLDPVARAKGLADTPAQIGPIHLKRDVWLGSNVTVLAGVTIGEGSVIATGSIVTKDIPAGVLAGGVPAKVIRAIAADI